MRRHALRTDWPPSRTSWKRPQHAPRPISICKRQREEWIWHGATLPDGRKVDAGLYRDLRDREIARLGGIPKDGPGRLADAATILDELVLSEELIPFLTEPAYDLLRTT